MTATGSSQKSATKVNQQIHSSFLISKIFEVVALSKGMNRNDDCRMGMRMALVTASISLLYAFAFVSIGAPAPYVYGLIIVALIQIATIRFFIRGHVTAGVSTIIALGYFCLMVVEGYIGDQLEVQVLVVVIFLIPLLIQPAQKNWIMIGCLVVSFAIISGPNWLSTFIQPKLIATDVSSRFRLLIDSTAFAFIVYQFYWLRTSLENKNKMVAEQATVLSKAVSENQHLFRIIAHDLKTPLIHALKISQSQSEGAAAKPSIAQRIEPHIKSVLEMINNLAYQTHAAKRAIPAEYFQCFKVKDLFRILSEIFQTRAQEKNIALVFGLNALETEMIFDFETICHQVLANLISNSIKFTPSGFIVSVRAEMNSQGLTFFVEDEGVGFPSDHYNGDSTRRMGTQGEVGMGLGLKIAAQASQNLGMYLEVVDRSSYNLGARGVLARVIVPRNLLTPGAII